MLTADIVHNFTRIMREFITNDGVRNDPPTIGGALIMLDGLDALVDGDEGRVVDLMAEMSTINAVADRT